MRHHLLKTAVLAAATAAALLAPVRGHAQNGETYIKLNALYALGGVINPSAEFVLSPHSAMAMDITYSPWRSIKGAHANFGIFSSEYRYYFKQSARGWYVSGNVGMMGFDISKPQLFKNKQLISIRTDRYHKGFGMMVGFGAGYQHVFAKRWVVDAFVAFDYMLTWYNGYTANGEINMHPYGHENYLYPDPFNASAEFMPAKIGVSIGYRLFDPAKHRAKK